MAKTDPELWRKHVRERLAALKYSGELVELQKRGLAACGRKYRYTPKQWFKSFSKRSLSVEYRKWLIECDNIAEKYGLAQWTVVGLCLISGYNPEKQPFPIENKWPQIRVITEQKDPIFLEWLAYEAHLLGLYVVQRAGPSESSIIRLSNFQPSEPITKEHLPKQTSAFYIRTELPPGYPSEAAENLLKDARKLEKELLGHLGYKVQKRLRASKLVSKADKLRITESQLANRGLFEIVADIYPEGSQSKDNQRRKTIKTRRYRMRKRLVEPYKNGDNNKPENKGDLDSNDFPSES